MGFRSNYVTGGELAAWAWGMHRCVDYLVRDCDIRRHGIAVFGHSRMGKATLLAGALDERISMVVPHQSGTAGVALNRHDPSGSTGETVGDITGTFPDWFSDYYSQFAGRVERLPFDQHHLVGLIAPRAILDTESTPAADANDGWTNPDASRLSVRLAHPVWELLDRHAIDADAISQLGGSIPDATPPIFHYRRAVGHTMTPEYWAAIYDFADQHLPQSGTSNVPWWAGRG